MYGKRPDSYYLLAYIRPPAKAAEVLRFVPLPEILSEIAGVGTGSKRVQTHYAHLLSKLGHELHILEQASLKDIQKEHVILAEAISRLRQGDVICEPGYDGKYGVIRLFHAKEL